ncbi:hypothetical protein [Rhizobium ruizarguesonis]|uniref:hypothetical protein n=1 Tax=Rhizobium ruizarguesonis TaxID=2081791 RepID=UPI00103024DD|nr:hypothetical protein [Rhizobium ruizarguesonis]TBD81042.1 hypothetical protein ELH11_14635 [Rhizobium ruizarguesonis]TBE12203.1 hypothetical protein ELH09_14715 [Rhizobium ruizarguesonis]WSH32164.1 hypothetical protein U8P70_16565 [Rhizobium ruizarguesonis]
MNVPAIFFTCFAAFGITGFVLQAQEQKKDDYIPQSIIENMTLDATKEDVFININCDAGQTIARYSIKTNVPSISPSVFVATGSSLGDFVYGLPKEVVLGFVGGAGGGISIAKIAQETSKVAGKAWSRQSWFNRVAAAVVGTVSGYYVGTYLAQKFEPTCGSKRFQDRLQDLKFWVAIKRAVIVTTYVSITRCSQERTKSAVAGTATDEDIQQASDLFWLRIDDQSVKDVSFETISRGMSAIRRCIKRHQKSQPL